MSWLLASGSLSTGASASAPVLPTGSISFSVDWFDLLDVQGTLRSLRVAILPRAQPRGWTQDGPLPATMSPAFTPGEAEVGIWGKLRNSHNQVKHPLLSSEFSASLAHSPPQYPHGPHEREMLVKFIHKRNWAFPCRVSRQAGRAPWRRK